MKAVHLIAGLPRAGSTLLANILAQNPRFHATSTSGILDILFTVRNAWDKLSEFRAAPDEEAKVRVLRGIVASYFAKVDRPVVFDKARSWLAHLELANLLMNKKAKVLVPVRDLRDVLASFEKLYRSNPTHQTGQERDNYFEWQTVQGRCSIWMRPNQPVGIAVNRIRDVLARGLGDQLHLVQFERLTSAPKETMQAVYRFLGEQYYEHDFDAVEQVTWEDDSVYGIPGLHNIRPEVRPMPSQWQDVLGAWAEPIAL